MDIKGIGMARRKRRKWSDEEKISICLKTKAPGISVSQVARRYAMSGNGNQIFNWLKDTRFAPAGDEPVVEDGVFLPVAISDDAEFSPQMGGSGGSASVSRLEIVLSGGHRLSAEGSFDGDALAQLLKGLIS